MMKDKIVSADEAIAIIRDRDTICTSGFVGVGTPDELLIALEKRYRETRHPSDLTLMFAAAPGDSKDRGLNRLAHDGLLKRVVGGHWALVPKLGRARARQPDRGLQSAARLHLASLSQHRRARTRHHLQGRTAHLRRSAAGGRQAERRTTEDLVELYADQWRGVAALQGVSDQRRAAAWHDRRSRRQYHDGAGSADARQSRDGDGGEEFPRLRDRPGRAHRRQPIRSIRARCKFRGFWSTAWWSRTRKTTSRPMARAYSHAFSGRQRVPMDRIKPLDLDERKIIARRCAFELPPGGVVNLGIGMPEGVAAVAAEEHMLKYLTLTAEPGIIGGMPQGGLNFGTALNPDAVIHQNQQFDFYDGGGLDLACLGMAQADAAGNVNVSRFGSTARRRRRLHQYLAERQKTGFRRHVHQRRLEDRHRGRRDAYPARRVDQEVHGRRSSRSPSAAITRPRPASRSFTSPSAASSQRTPAGVRD